jgi:hypothetical protein
MSVREALAGSIGVRETATPPQRPSRAYINPLAPDSEAARRQAELRRALTVASDGLAQSLWGTTGISRPPAGKDDR